MGIRATLFVQKEERCECFKQRDLYAKYFVYHSKSGVYPDLFAYT